MKNAYKNFTTSNVTINDIGTKLLYKIILIYKHVCIRENKNPSKESLEEIQNPISIKD